MTQDIDDSTKDPNNWIEFLRLQQVFTLPSIIFELGLSPFEMCLYTFFKRECSYVNECTLTQKEISHQCRISIRKLREAQKVLASPFDRLYGSPLIKIIPKFSEDGRNLASKVIIIY